MNVAGTMFCKALKHLLSMAKSVANKNNDNCEFFYWMKHISFRLPVINVCPVLVSSKLRLSTHFPTSEGWTVGLTVGMWLVVPTRDSNPRE